MRDQIRHLTLKLRDCPLDLRFVGWDDGKNELVLYKGRGALDFAVISKFCRHELSKSIRHHLKGSGELVYVRGGVSGIEQTIRAWVHKQQGGGGR